MGGDDWLLVWIQENITSGPFFLFFEISIDVEKLLVVVGG